MKIKSKFFISTHYAKRAGLHHDIRYKKPGNKNWDSYATKKEIPLNTNDKILIAKTREHSEKEALFVGTIESGYGAGKLEEWDSGDCYILKYGPNHIVIDFKGKKIKGIYHIISTGVADKNYKNDTYFFFKAKNQKYNF